jgi:hypothetical protein
VTDELNFTNKLLHTAKKSIRMKKIVTRVNRKRILIMLVLSVTSFAGGLKLKSLYGFDPPYTLFFGGYVLMFIGLMLALLAIGSAGVNLYKFISGKR